MLKDAPIGSPAFHIYNVLYLTIFTGIMTFGMLFVYYIAYVPPNPKADVEAMLGASASAYEITQNNLTLDALSSVEESERDLIESYFERASEIQRFYVTDKATGEPVMTVFSVASGGFGGPVRSMVGTDGTKVLSLKVLNVSAETAGLGQRVAEAKFQRQFLNKTIEDLPNDRSEWGKGLDMISGATFSSTTLVNNIKKAFDLYAVGEN